MMQLMQLYKTTFNGVTTKKALAVTLNIGVTDDGGTVALKTSDAIAAVTFKTAISAEGSADTTLQDVAISLGNVAAGIAALKGRQAVAYAASANLAAAAVKN